MSDAPQSGSSWGTFVLVGALAAIAIGLTTVRFRDHAPGRAPRLEPETPRSTQDRERVAEDESPAPERSSGTRSGARPPRAVVSGAAPPGCPEDEPDETGFVRPSLWELLALRSQELRDRLPQLSRDASPELRAGLERLRDPDARGTVDQLSGASDRVRDGFDVAVGVVMHLGMRALAEHRPEEARQLAERAARLAPDDPAPAVLAALAAGVLGRLSEERLSVARGYRLTPDEPALALEHARQQHRAGEREEAAEAVHRYLEAVPDDARVRSWSLRIREQRRALSGSRPHTRAGITVHYPRGALTDQRVVELLEAVRGALIEVARLTDTDAREELTVAIYPDAESMRRVTCTPGWTGGVFDGVLHLDAQAMGREGDHFLRIVRHETTHAQLAMLRGRLPTWLNEGLAQHLEGEPSASVRRSWARMARASLVIPFASLEGQLVVIDDANDARLAYHQSLLMVQLLLERRGVRGLREALAECVAGRREDLFTRMLPRVDSAALLTFAASR